MRHIEQNRTSAKPHTPMAKFEEVKLLEESSSDGTIPSELKKMSNRKQKCKRASTPKGLAKSQDEVAASTPSNENRKKKRMRVIGFNYEHAASNAKAGKKPTCEGCNEAMDKLDKRVVHKRVGAGPDGKWESLEFLHLKPHCLKHMPGEMMEELKNKHYNRQCPPCKHW